MSSWADEAATGGLAWRESSAIAYRRRYEAFVAFQLSAANPIIWSLTNLSINESGTDFATGTVSNGRSAGTWKFSLQFHQSGFLRLQITEVNSLYERFAFNPQCNDGVLSKSLNEEFILPNKVEPCQSNSTIFHFGTRQIQLDHVPFRVRVFADDVQRYVVCGQQLLNLERYRERKTFKKETEARKIRDAVDLDAEDAWEYTHPTFIDQEGKVCGGWCDTNPRGPAAVACDITVFDVERIGGFFEHSVELNLPDFAEGYRFFNSDRFAYPLNSPVPLYGAIPLACTLHRDHKWTAALWLNPSDTFGWVKRTHKADLEMHSSLRFASETGTVDISIFTGPSLDAVMSQFHGLTGLPHLPPLWALGRHQCRWNYNDQDDVDFVSNECIAASIPTDAVWLDIEHTAGRKYFEWDLQKFPSPRQMIKKLAEKHQRLVTIIDPHIKAEKNWRVFEAMDNCAIRRPDTKPLIGRCWPGESVYPDYTDRAVRRAFSQFLQEGVYTTGHVHVWNDMNEPSVFEGPEQTIPRDCLHLNGREHRELHNLYGLAFTRANYEGLSLALSTTNQRPFVLTRAFMTGIHKYAAVWLGDSVARWQYLRVSVPMMLSAALCGQSFVGGDIAGFVGDPSEELRLRWAQLGSWMPFCREHASIDTKRREPYLLENKAIMKEIRKAYWLRAALTPMWGIWAHAWSTTGKPMLKPLWASRCAASKEMDTFENVEFFVGDNVLIRAIGHSMQQLECLRSARRSDTTEWTQSTWSGCPRTRPRGRDVKDQEEVDFEVCATSAEPNGEGSKPADETEIQKKVLDEAKRAKELMEYDDDHSLTYQQNISEIKSSIKTYLPKCSTWYRLSLECLLGEQIASRKDGGIFSIPVGLCGGLPAWVRAGTILFTRLAYTLPVMQQLTKPLGAAIFLDRAQSASGELRVDDGETDEAFHQLWRISRGIWQVVLTRETIRESANINTEVSRIVIHGLQTKVMRARANEKELPVVCWTEGEDWTAILNPGLATEIILT